MTKEEAIATFGIDPDETGNRPRGWWVVSDPDYEEQMHNIEKGFLCVKTRDGGSNPICKDALKSGDCVTTFEDDYDRTYRYYYYRPLRAALGEKE